LPIQLFCDFIAGSTSYLKLIGGSVEEYLSGVYSKSSEQTSSAPITTALTRIEVLCDEASRLQNCILQKDGIGRAWKDAEGTCKQLRETRCMLEDLACYALLGFDEVISAHDKGILAYQNISQ
jgi:hypothetical protein